MASLIELMERRRRGEGRPALQEERERVVTAVQPWKMEIERAEEEKGGRLEG